jgi:hypothetical protein
MSKLFMQFYMLNASLLFCLKLTMWQDGVNCQRYNVAFVGRPLHGGLSSQETYRLDMSQQVQWEMFVLKRVR